MTKKSTKFPRKKKLQVGDEVFQPLDVNPMGIKPIPASENILGSTPIINTAQERARKAQMERYAKMSPRQQRKEREKYSGLVVTPSPINTPPVYTEEEYPNTYLNQEQTLRNSELEVNLPESVKQAQRLNREAETVQSKSRDPFRNPFSNIKGHDVINVGMYGLGSALMRNEAIQNQQEFLKKVRIAGEQTPRFYQQPKDPGRIVYGREGADIRRGTSPDITNVEVEGGEFIQLPDMSTQRVYGPSHEDGGVHTNLPDGARVFSNFIGPIDSKKTYAKLAEKYNTEKHRKVLDNPYAADVDRNTAKLMFQKNESILNELFEDQQRQNGNSDGRDQANNMAKFGLDLKKGEKLSFTDPFEYGGVYTGGGAEFLDGGEFEMMGENKSPYYLYDNPPVYRNTNQGFYDVKGNNYFQVGGQTGAGTVTQDPIQSIAELKQKILSDPKLKEDFVKEYKKLFPKTPATAEDLFAALETVTSNITAIRSKASEEELRAAELDKGTKNVKYKELAKKYGVPPVEDENMIKRFQGVYRTLATLQEDENFAPILAEYELTPVGVDDSKWKGSLYSGKGISEVDGWFGNTTIGQLVRRKQPAATATKDTGDKVVETPQDTSGSDIGYKGTYEAYPSTMGKFPLYQAAPEALGYMYANRPYSYYTPDFTHTEINAPTLNIDPELQAIQDSFQSAIRQNTGNASIGNARNAAMYTQALNAMMQDFGKKQNYDAQARFQADQYNATARDQENVRDLTAAASIYNDYMATAQDAAEAERLAAINSLTNKYGKYRQDELAKIFNVTNLMPNYYYDGRDPNNPLKRNPYRQNFYNRPLPGTKTTTANTPVNTPVAPPVNTGLIPVVPQNMSNALVPQPVIDNESLVIPELNPAVRKPGYGWGYDNFVPNIPDEFMYGGKIYKK